MNKVASLGAVVVVVLVIAGIAIYYGMAKSPGSPVSAASTVASGVKNASSSTPNTSTGVVTAGTTAVSTAPAPTTLANTTKPAVCSKYPGYLCAAVTCTPSNSTFTCSNATYLYSPSTNESMLFVTFSQKTGREWSGFGVAYVPSTTKIVSGTPQNTVWYSENYTSKNNVGTSLQSNTLVNVLADNNEKGVGFGATVNGTVWACFTNSGLVYVGNSCIVNGGGSAVPTYVEIGKVA